MTSRTDLHSGRKLARNALLNFIGQVLPLLVGVLALPIIIKGLGTDAFGAFQLAWVILGYFAMFDLGMGRATNKFVAEYVGRDDIQAIPTIVAITTTIQCALGVFAGLTFAVLVPTLVHRVFNVPAALVQDTTRAFYLLALAVPVVLLATSFRGILQAVQRFDLVNVVQVAAGVATYTSPIVVLSLGSGLVGVVAVVLTVRIVALAAYVFFSIRTFPILRGPWGFDRSILKSLLAYGGWITVSNILSPLMVSLDRLLIGSLLTLSAVTYYSAPYDVISRLAIIPGSILPPLFSAFSAVSATDDETRLGDLFRTSAKYLTLLMGPIALALVILAGPGLRIWLGQDFAIRSALPAQILVVAMLVNGLAQLPHAMLQGVGRADLPAKFHMVELPLHAVLLWFLIMRWGIVGAAAAWLIRVSFDALLLYCAASRNQRTEIRRFVRPVFVPSGGLLVVLASGALIVSGLHDYVLVDIACAGIAVSLFIVVAWKFILEPADRRSILMLIRFGFDRERSGEA